MDDDQKQNRADKTEPPTPNVEQFASDIYDGNEVDDDMVVTNQRKLKGIVKLSQTKNNGQRGKNMSMVGEYRDISHHEQINQSFANPRPSISQMSNDPQGGRKEIDSPFLRPTDNRRRNTV